MAGGTLRVVGEYRETFNTVTSSSLPCGNVYISAGLSVHLQKRHPGCIGYVDYIPDIIASPDYIGKNPNEPDSVELVKVYGENVQIAIKLDKKENYLYVASLYDVTQSKIERRLVSGRLKPLSQAAKFT